MEGKEAQEDFKKSKSKSRKGKGSYGRTRLQLFDPSSKSDLGKLSDGGFVQLLLENEVVVEEGNCGSEERETVSLDFESGSDDDDDEVEDLPRDDGMERTGGDKGSGGGLFCGTCNVGFADVAEQRLHYTLDWHRYNLKRRLKLNEEGGVTEAKFYEMMDDLSSIDGSDDEEEDVTTAGAQLERLMGKLQTSPSKQTEVVRLSSSQKMEKSPKIFFKNQKGQVITCYKTIMDSISIKPEEGDSSATPVSNFMKIMESPLRITIIMTSGGHFAAAVFEGSTCINHKTFHSYTVRAKQGGSQGSRDAKSGTSHPKSAGASLRRYNEQSFTQHVQDLLTSWKSSIADSNLIFYRAISSNANVLFGGKSPALNKDSQKLRTIPFPTKRPTFSEVKRVHSLLTTLHVYESMDNFLAAHSHLNKNSDKTKTSPAKTNKPHNRAKSRSPKRKDELDIIREPREESDNDQEDIGPLEEVELTVDFSDLKEYDDSLTPEQRREGKGKKKSKKPKADTAFKLEGLLGDLAAVILKRDIESFQQLLGSISNGNNSVDLNQPVDIQSSTLLHEAARKDLNDVVWSLMEAGSDPAVKDKSGKYPYNYAESRECRDTFRRFMGEFPEKYDYKKAQVPPPLSDEMEKERAEKKKLLNKLKREKEKQKKMERKEKDKETEEQRRFLNLSDREKRALAAEQRILAQCKRNSEQVPVLVRCFECATDITGKVPFEYNQNVFCTPKCLAAHRKKFPCPLSV